VIDISKLTKKDVGRAVLYHREYCTPERGVLTSWNAHYVFVKFRGQNGESCEPEDVSFANEEP
jgi:hypothetical protein